jgi:hypothetical protein
MSVGAKVATLPLLAERTALVGTAAQALGLVAVPDIGHAVFLDTFVDSPHRAVVRDTVLFHGYLRLTFDFAPGADNGFFERDVPVTG